MSCWYWLKEAYSQVFVLDFPSPLPVFCHSESQEAKMSKFEITMFMFIDVRLDDPEGSRSQCVTVKIENICPSLPVSHQKREKHHPRNLSTVMAISALKDFSGLPGSQHHCFLWNLDSCDFSKTHHNVLYFFMLYLLLLLSIFFISCQK